MKERPRPPGSCPGRGGLGDLLEPLEAKVEAGPQAVDSGVGQPSPRSRTPGPAEQPGAQTEHLAICTVSWQGYGRLRNPARLGPALGMPLGFVLFLQSFILVCLTGVFVPKDWGNTRTGQKPWSGRTTLS